MKYKYEFRRQPSGDYFLYENGVYTYIKVTREMSQDMLCLTLDIEAEVLKSIYKDLLYLHNGMSDLNEGFCSTPDEALDVRLGLAAAWTEKDLSSTPPSNSQLLEQVFESQRLGQPTPELAQSYVRIVLGSSSTQQRALTPLRTLHS